MFLWLCVAEPGSSNNYKGMSLYGMTFPCWTSKGHTIFIAPVLDPGQYLTSGFGIWENFSPLCSLFVPRVYNHTPLPQYLSMWQPLHLHRDCSWPWPIHFVPRTDTPGCCCCICVFAMLVFPDLEVNYKNWNLILTYSHCAQVFFLMSLQLKISLWHEMEGSPLIFIE